VQRSPVCKTCCEPSPCLRQLGDHLGVIVTALIIVNMYLVRQAGHPSKQQILSVVILTAAGAVRPLPEFIIKIELKMKVRRIWRLCYLKQSPPVSVEWSGTLDDAWLKVWNLNWRAGYVAASNLSENSRDESDSIKHVSQVALSYWTPLLIRTDAHHGYISIHCNKYVGIKTSIQLNTRLCK